MTHFYEVTYTIYEDNNVYKQGTFGIVHDKKCINTVFKTIIRRTLPADKKLLDIEITKSELISEEEAKRRFGTNISTVSFKHRLVR